MRLDAPCWKLNLAMRKRLISLFQQPFFIYIDHIRRGFGILEMLADVSDQFIPCSEIFCFALPFASESRHDFALPPIPHTGCGKERPPGKASRPISRQ